MQSAKPPFRRSSSRSRPCDATRALLGARYPPDTTKAGRLPGFDAKRGRAALKFIQPEIPWGLAAAIVATRRARVNGEPPDELQLPTADTSWTVGQTRPVPAKVLAKGNTIEGLTVTWTSSNEAVATVDATGAVTGKTPGGSRVQIGGPTGAFIPIIYGIVAIHGFANLMGATMLAGVFLLAMGLARMGQLIRFIPVTVVIGFTNGIAVVIFLAQIKDFFGLQIDNLPAEFFGRIKTLAANAHTVDLPTLALASVCFVFLLSYNRLAQRFAFMRRAPGPLVVLIVGTLVSFIFNLPVETIGSRFNGIPQELPNIGFPSLSIHDFGKLISPAITIALLGAIESLLSARVADSQIDDRHDPNQELVAQGLANIAAPLFGGFAATGAIARTTTNVKTGGRTPIAGIIHALVLLGIVLIAAPLASYVPLATLSAIVMVVAVNMGEWHHFRELEHQRGVLVELLLRTDHELVHHLARVAVDESHRLAESHIDAIGHEPHRV